MNYGTKLVFLTLIPIVLIVAAIFYVIDQQAKQLSENQAATIETAILELKKQELRNYVSLAEKAIGSTYNSYLKTKRQAQYDAKEIIRKMSINEDQYFFIFDEEGNSIIEPRFSYMVGRNWIGLEDKEGNRIVENLIANAKVEDGFYSYIWQKPSTREYLTKLTHGTYFDRWNWTLNTGVYLDDVDEQVVAVKADLRASFSQTQSKVVVLALGALASTALIMGLFQFTQKRLADAQLKLLNTRLVNVQEEERKRVSTELHDGISQLLISSRYALEAALETTKPNTKLSKSVNKSMQAMDDAVSEVRRISLALRPTALDDVGLAAAIKTLGKDFQSSTGITTVVNTVPIQDLLADDAKTALYRIAQEALTNIAKHSNATRADIKLQKSPKEVRLLVKDNGIGLNRNSKSKQTSGLGLLNMQERVETFDGRISIDNGKDGGAEISVSLPVQA